MSVVKAEATPVGQHWFQCPGGLHDPVTAAAPSRMQYRLKTADAVAFVILSIWSWNYNEWCVKML